MAKLNKILHQSTVITKGHVSLLLDYLNSNAATVADNSRLLTEQESRDNIVQIPMSTMRPRSLDLSVFGFDKSLAQDTTCYTVCPSYDLPYEETECGEEVGTSYLSTIEVKSWQIAALKTQILNRGYEKYFHVFRLS